MAGKQGRPRRKTNAETNEIGQGEKNEAKEVNLEEKVIEKIAPKVNQETMVKQRPLQSKTRTYTIFIKGKPREVSRPTYDALKKDVKLQVTLPKNSPLVEPPAKPCKDC
jgi:hypothetical protein